MGNCLGDCFGTLFEKKNDKPDVPDFTTKWPGSDVILQTRESNGRELYFSQKILSRHSPYFRHMFQEQRDVWFVELPQDEYATVLEVLHILYNEGKPCKTELYSREMLSALRRFGNFYVVPPVMEIYTSQNKRHIDVEILERYLSDENCTEKRVAMAIDRMSRQALLHFLRKENSDELCLTPELLKKISKKLNDPNPLSQEDISNFISPSPSRLHFSPQTAILPFELTNMSRLPVACRIVSTDSSLCLPFCLAPGESFETEIHRHLKMDKLLVEFTPIVGVSSGVNPHFRDTRPTGTLQVPIDY